jgi:hypothetical protein
VSYLVGGLDPVQDYHMHVVHDGELAHFGMQKRAPTVCSIRCNAQYRSLVPSPEVCLDLSVSSPWFDL